MIYIIEIPHQRPPRAWYAETRDQVVAAIAETARRSGDTIWEFDAHIEWLHRDLSSMIVCESDDEALQLYRDGIAGHGGAAATGALGRALSANGILEEE